MAYNLTILPQAQEEINQIFEYYKHLPNSVLVKFDKEIEKVYQTLEKNPFYKVRYKHLRAIPFKSFPYLVFFDIVEENQMVYIYSVFHTSQNPNNYPKI